MKKAFVLGLLLLGGCFEHHVVDPSADAGRVDARVDAAPAVDTGICLCASDLDCPAREGCVEHLCIDCLCQPRMVERCGECMCVSDADCPTPPPFGECIRTRCTDCICSFFADDSVCEDGASCDPDTFLCTSFVGVHVVVRTDYQPVDDFDRIVASTERETFEYRPVRDDPFASMGVEVGELRGRPGEELLIHAELGLGERLVDERDVRVFVEESGSVVTLIFAR